MMNSSTTRKRHRTPSHHHHQYLHHRAIDGYPNKSPSLDFTCKLRRTSSSTSVNGPGASTAATTTAASSVATFTAASCAASFNDPATADVILRLYIDCSPLGQADDQSSRSPFSGIDDGIDHRDDEALQLYLHSHVLRGAKYFAALLSDRWRNPEADGHVYLKLPVTGCSISSHLALLKLLYTEDFDGVIDSASRALDLLPVALELLFDDCVRACIRFLEAVPWTEEEEGRVIGLVPFLREEESRDLLARVCPSKKDPSEEMLLGLILAATHSHSNIAFAKAFVAKLLRDFSSREMARKVLEQAFRTSLKVMKESLEKYSSPDFRGDYNETEAMQRLNLYTAMTNGKHLLWLVERMIELRVADMAVKEWSEQVSVTGDLQRAFRDDAWRNMAPGLPAVVLRCTSKLANAVATGTILAARQVRLKLVKEWLPVLIACKDNVSPVLPSHRSLYLELEETFLRIISTLPMAEAQELLKRCLSFSTRNVEDCPHLVTAFNTWFRRAAWASRPDKAV